MNQEFSINTNNGENGATEKRKDYIDWTEYFMAMAFLAAKRSKDPTYQVGACIVDRANKIVAIGYNGMPIGCSDDEFPWGKSNSPLDDKLLYVCHAEMNAITNKNSANVNNCTMYVCLFPCNECAKMIIQSGITEVVYYSDKSAHKPKYIASKRMFDAAGVKYWQYIPKRDKIEINFTENVAVSQTNGVTQTNGVSETNGVTEINKPTELNLNGLSLNDF